MGNQSAECGKGNTYHDWENKRRIRICSCAQPHPRPGGVTTHEVVPPPPRHDATVRRSRPTEPLQVAKHELDVAGVPRGGEGRLSRVFFVAGTFGSRIWWKARASGEPPPETFPRFWLASRVADPGTHGAQRRHRRVRRDVTRVGASELGHSCTCPRFKKNELAPNEQRAQIRSCPSLSSVTRRPHARVSRAPVSGPFLRSPGTGPRLPTRNAKCVVAPASRASNNAATRRWRYKRLVKMRSAKAWRPCGRSC